MSDARQRFGLEGEQLAVEALRARGYVVIAVRYRTRLGEIDIVARDAHTLVFVEVKARTGPAFGGAAAAVHARKQRRLTRLAEAFMAETGGRQGPCRFDVVAVEWPEGQAPQVEVFRGAFDAQ